MNVPLSHHLNAMYATFNARPQLVQVELIPIIAEDDFLSLLKVNTKIRSINYHWEKFILSYC